MRGTGSPPPRRRDDGQQREERGHCLEHDLARVLDRPGVQRQCQAAERVDEREQDGRGDPERGLCEACGVERLCRQVARLWRGGGPVRDLGERLERREREAGDDLRERRVLGPVVVAEQDAGVAGLEPDRVLLARPEVVVLVEVGREGVDRGQPCDERDDADPDGEGDRHQRTQRRQTGTHRAMVGCRDLPRPVPLSGSGDSRRSVSR
jgi:hypothetical protein